MTLYEELGVAPDASVEEIGEAMEIEELAPDLKRLLNNPRAYLSGCEREILERVLCGELHVGDARKCSVILQNHCQEVTA